MQIVREIRLPVSEVVDGSYHSPALTVDGKDGNMKGLATLEPADNAATLMNCLQ